LRAKVKNNLWNKQMKNDTNGRKTIATDRRTHAASRIGCGGAAQISEVRNGYRFFLRTLPFQNTLPT
jgi:hypothetical protein